MITKAQALSEREFHESGITRTNGTCYVWRRNGQTQTWKTRPNDWRIPVKYGLRSYGQIRDYDAHLYHVPSECPNRDDRNAASRAQHWG